MKKTILIILTLVILAGIFGAYELISIIKSLPLPEKISYLQPTQSTKIYDRTGQVLLYEIHGDQNRTIISSSDIPDFAKKATVAIEDQGFYSHNGVDLKALARAFFTDITQGGFVQGASTITQQLVKNTFLTSEKTITRKIKELVLSYWVEQHYSKDEILTQYLNQIPYGSNAYGIESASQMLFGKSAKDLTLAQAATLSALIQSPSYYSPWGKHLNELLQRKNYVLEQMEKLSFITPDQYNQAKNEQLVFMPQTIGAIKAPHFSMMVKDYLTEKYGDDLVNNGGLKVTTTLDWNQQQIAEKAVSDGAKRNAEMYKGKNAALVAQDPKTGQILALVGSADYFDPSIDGNFNVASQGLRQPGSTFKPFAYLTAFEKGYTPDTIVFNTPTEFSTNQTQCPLVPNFSVKNTACFHPQNFDGMFSGPISLKQALAESVNVASVKTLYLAGLDDTINTAQKMGITTLTDRSRYGLSLVLGGGEVKLVDLVNAYSVFAQEGVQHNQTFILNVQDPQGNTLEEYKDQANQIIEPQYTRMIDDILSNSDLRSGLFHSSLYLTIYNGYQVALKTGTTNDYRDAWVMGYTPFLTVGVWAGNSNNTPMQQQGGSILAAVPIWNAFLSQVINTYQPEFFNKPDQVTSSKPMLNGQYVNPINGIPQIHDILYYVDKNNPENNSTQPNPGNDPQFTNWETGVINWARQNIPNFDSSYNK